MLAALKKSLPKFQWKKNKKEPTANDNESKSILSDIKNNLGFIGEAYDTVHEEISIAKEKSKDLRKSNYELGMNFLEKGNIGEAIFRFRIMGLLWPEMLDAQYQLAYCLAQKKQFRKSEKVLEKILNKDPNYDNKARDLLEEVRSNLNVR